MNQLIRVLLIDDDEDDFVITKELLQEIPARHYELEWAASYQEGERLLLEKKPDVCLIDYRLGAFTGLDLIQEAQQKGLRIPFILLTGQGDLEIDERAMRLGATDYLVKGTIDAAMLERSIRHSMEHNASLTRSQSLNEELEERVRQRTAELDLAIAKLKTANDTLSRQIRYREITEEALRDSQRLYTAIAQNFPNGTINVLDRELRYVFVDGKELTELQLSKERLMGKKFFEYFYPKTDEEKAAITRYEAMLESVFQGKETLFEVDYKGRIYELHAVPLSGSNEEIRQILVVSANITERRKAEEDTQKALDKERQLNELKSRFVSTASHEFRTPLSTILSSVALISRYKDADSYDKRQKHVERIKSSVNNLTQILNDFLSLSKLEEGITTMHISELNIVNLMTSIIEEMTPVAKAGQAIRYHHLGGEASVLMDSQVFKNVLINLLSNAIKYSEEGDLIEVYSETIGQRVHLRVVDRGMGIPEADQPHLFNRFFRAENAINIQGTGLGLHIVKKYIDLLGGTISFESQLGKGTTFTLELPKVAHTVAAASSSEV